MRLQTLALRNGVRHWLVAVTLAVLSSPALPAGTFGKVISLPGHISELVLDEQRAVLYAADFTAGQVDVISTATNRLVSSLSAGRSPSGIALSPDGQYLVVTNYNNLGVPTISSVTVVNLNDLSRQNYAVAHPPLAVAFGADGTALIMTTVDIQRFTPNGGNFEVVATIDSLGDFIPVLAPEFPREITKASMTASGDGNYIFGLSNSFLFVYQVPQPSAVLNVRLLTSLPGALTPPLISAAFDGSYFMAGQFLLDRRLRVMAQHPDLITSQLNIGGHAIDFGQRKLYSSFAEASTAPSSTTTTGTGTGGTGTGGTGTGTGTGGTTSGTGNVPAGGSGTSSVNLLPPRLLVQDTDNLTVHDKLNLPERITGRIVLGGGGRYGYAMAESGVMYLPFSDLATVPFIRPSTDQVVMQLDFCERGSFRTQFRINGTGDFRVTSNIVGGRDSGLTLKGVSFSPSEGTAPAVIDVLVDSTDYTKVQGTTYGQIVVTSTSAVNQIDPITLAINVKDVDQRGRMVPLAGKLVDIVADPRRDQFYVLEQTKNEVHVFQNSDLRLLGTFRTGNRPTWMTLTGDRHYLLIANSFGENLTVINLDTMQNEGYFFLPAGETPATVASDNSTTLVAVRTPDNNPHLDMLQVSNRFVQTPKELGVYANLVHTNTAMVPLANGSGILIAQADGTVLLWDSARQEVTLARRISTTGLRGAIAAGTNALVVDNNILNNALVVQAQFATAAPSIPAGFTFLGDTAIRTASPSGVVTDTGTILRFDVRTPLVSRGPVRLVEAPLTPLTFPFLRSLAGLRNGTIVSTSSTGLIEVPNNFDASIAIPRVTAITSAADFSDSLAPGSLISIFGQNLAPTTASAAATPLPTSLGNICVTVNGIRMPMLYTSPSQINGQLPFEVDGQASLVLHSPGGLSDTYYADVRNTAPSVFQLSIAGQSGTFPAVVRMTNGQLATLSNPLRKNETVLIYATGLGEVGPTVDTGAAGPSSPLAIARTQPTITVGGRAAGIYFAGLAPGFVGVYQLNIKVPGDVPAGMSIPLTISAGSADTTINVRVVD